MNQLVEACINKIYKEKDYQYFRERSRKVPIYLSKIEEAVQIICRKMDICALKNDPMIEIYLKFVKIEFVLRITKYRIEVLK